MIDLNKLFRRLGRLAGLLKSVAYHQQDDLLAAINSLLAEFSAMPGPVAGLLRTPRLAADAPGQVLSNRNLEAFVVDAARRTLLETVDADQPNESWDVPKAVAEVIRQMKAVGATVPDCVVAYTTSASPLLANPGEPNAGLGAILVGLREPSYVKCDNVFAEQLRVSVNNADTANEETWIVRGAVPALGLFSHDWPRGSAAVGTLTTADPAGTPGSGQNQTVLTDGSFEEWDDANTLSWWTDVAVTRSEVAYNVFTGETRYAANFFGTFDTGVFQVASVTQTMDPTLLRASTVYGIAFRARLTDAGNFATFTAATIRAELQNAETGAAINDVGGNPLRLDLTWNAHSTDWRLASAVWITPRRMPQVAHLKLTTTGVNIAGDGDYAGLAYVDHVVLFPLVYPYPGGPALGVIAGARPWQVGDSLEVTVTNNRAGAAFGFTWQAVWDRFFGDRANGLYLPTGTPATIGDDLIDVDPPIISPPPPPPPPGTGSLAVHAWFDTDGDGVQDAGEADAANRLVYIIGPISTAATTNDLGDVVFSGLPPGDYAIFITLLAGESCDANGGEETVTSGGSASAARGIEIFVPPEEDYWNLTINTNRPFRAVTAVGPSTYNGFTDGTGRLVFLDITGPAGEEYVVTLESNSLEEAVWNSYSDPNADSGGGFVADIVLGDGEDSTNSIVNFTVSSPEDPPGAYGHIYGRVYGPADYEGFTPPDQWTATLNELGLTATLSRLPVAPHIADFQFSSPLIVNGGSYSVTIEKTAGAADLLDSEWGWEEGFFDQVPPVFPTDFEETGTGFTAAGTVILELGEVRAGIEFYLSESTGGMMALAVDSTGEAAPDLVSIPVETFGPFNPDAEVQE